jgi:hypothetical protein
MIFKPSIGTANEFIISRYFTWYEGWKSNEDAGAGSGGGSSAQRFLRTKTRQKLHKKICEIVLVRLMLVTI